MAKGMAPLAYLKTQLGFTLGEWSKLPVEDQQWYRAAAVEEMNAVGIEVSVAVAK